MSYYCNVTIGMSIKTFHDLWEYEKEHVDSHGSMLDKMTNFVVREDKTVVLVWEDVEWRRIPAAQRIDDFLHDVSEQGERAFSYFIMGEELDDAEECFITGSEEQEPISGIEIQRKIVITSQDKDNTYLNRPTFNDLKDF